MTIERPGFRLPVGLTIATAIALAILISLGVWQVKRLAWKEDLLARVAALQAAPARPAGPALAEGVAADFMRVTLDCPGLSHAPYLQLYALRGPQAGTRLISACAVEGGAYRTILVDRGFVADTISARPPVDAADRTPLTVTGVLRRPDKKTFVTQANDPAKNSWFSRDVPAMAAALHAPDPAPLMLFAETSSNPEWKALIPAPLPAEIPNRHLEYALTWFGLAGALLAVYAAMLWRKRKV